MSNNLSYASLSKYQTEVQKALDSLKRNKLKVTNHEFLKMHLLRLCIVGGNATFNGFYGYSLGVSATSMVLLACTFFAGDFALAILHEVFPGKSSLRTSCIAAKVGLFLLSITAGTAFMLSMRHGQDIKHSSAHLLEAQIASESASISSMPSRYVTMRNEAHERISALQERLEQERRRIGANYASTNAIYLYLARSLGFKYEVVSLAISIFWILVLLVTGIALSASLAAVWCPHMELRVRRQIRKQFVAIAREQQKFLNSVGTKPSQPSNNYSFQEASKKTNKSIRQKSGAYESAYKEFLEELKSGKLSPSQSAIKKRFRVGQEIIQQWQEKATHEGVLYRATTTGKYRIVPNTY